MSTIVFQDTFTGTDGTALTSHTPGIGSSWATLTGKTSPLISNANRAHTSGDGASDEVRAVHATLTGRGVVVEGDCCVISQGSTSTTGIYLRAHCDTGGGQTFYELQFVISSGTCCSLRRYSSGSSSPLGSGTSTGFTATAGDVYHLKLSVVPSGADNVVSAAVTRASDGFYLTPSGTFQAGASDPTGGFTDTSPIATGQGGFRFYEYTSNSVGYHLDNFQVTDPAASSISATVTETPLPSNHLGNITVHVVGTGTSFSSSTTWTASGVSGWSVASKTAVDSTHQTVVLTPPTSASPPAGATGTLTLTEGVTGTVAATTTVATPTLGISPTTGQVGTTPTLTLTGANTLWSSETAAGLFTLSGGTGASVGTPTVATNTAATDALTVGSAAGTLTITDHSTGATATYTATVVTFSAGTPAAVSGPAGVALYLDGTNGSTAPAGSGTTTYQWHRSTDPGFTPVSGTQLAGATASTLADGSGLEGVAYFYNCAVANSSGSGNAGQAIGQKVRASLKVGFLGDSLYANSSGTYSPPSAFAALVAYRSGHAYAVATSNRAIAGTATADWVSASTDLVAAKSAFVSALGSPSASNPVWIFLRIGANDALAAVAAATYGSNLASQVNDLVAAGYRVILNYPTYGADAGSYGGAGNTRVRGYMPYIDALVNGSTVFAGDKRLWDYSAAFPGFRAGDDIHPGPAGILLIAQEDADTLLSLVNPAPSKVRNRIGSK